MIGPFTVRVNCQIRGLTSIRKGLRKDDTPFLVSSDSIIASENVSGRVLGVNLKNPREAIFTNPEGSQSGGVQILPVRRGPILPIRRGLVLPIRRGPNYANPEGLILSIRRGLILPIRRGPILPIRRGPFLPIRRGPIFFNPEGYSFVKT